MTVAKVSKGPDWYCQHRQAGRDNLDWQAFVEILLRASQSSRDLHLLVQVVNLIEGLKLSLSHYHLEGLTVFELDIYRQNSDANFVMNARPAVSVGGQGNNAFARQDVPCAHDRMACKRNLARGREDA